MKASTSTARTSLFRAPRPCDRGGRRSILHVALFVAAASIVGCNQGAEGDRCNPDLSHDECNSGLSCTQPPQCPENYCCPTTGASSDPNCQPGCTPGGVAALCATDPTAAACVDAGADAGADAEAPDAPANADTGMVGDSGGMDTGAKDASPKDSGSRG